MTCCLCPLYLLRFYGDSPDVLREEEDTHTRAHTHTVTDQTFTLNVCKSVFECLFGETGGFFLLQALLAAPPVGGFRRRAAHLGVQQQLLLVKVQQRHRAGLGVVDEDLQAGVERGALTVGPAGEHTLEHLLWTRNRHHLLDKRSTAALRR